MPSDLVGTRIYRPDQGTFETELGPVFANFLLADEINRAPAKVQSALLEVMQEHQVTIGHTTYPVPAPFIVLATENPIEAEGTYPLPEAQVDRFMLKILLGYPSAAEEAQVVARSLRPRPAAREVLDAEGLPAPPGPARRRLRRPAHHQLRRRARRGHPPARLLGRPRARAVRLLRREPARLDQPHPRRPRARDAARPPLRAAVRRRRAGARRPAPPPRHELRGAHRRHHAGLGHRARSWRSSRRRASRSRWSPRRDRPRPDHAARRGPRPGRVPGPSPTTSSGGSRSTLARRVGGRLTGDHRGAGLGRRAGPRPDPALRAGRRHPPHRLERHRPQPGPAGPRGRARSAADGLAPARHVGLDALRHRRPAQGRRRRGRGPRRRAVRRPAGRTASASSPSAPAARRDHRRRPAAATACSGCSARSPSRRPTRAAAGSTLAQALRTRRGVADDRRPRRDRLRLPRPARLAPGADRGRRPAHASSRSRSSIRARTRSSTSAS